MNGLTLDTGALIAVERGDQRAVALLARATSSADAMLHIPAGVLAQAFRDGRRQVRLTRLLSSRQTRVVPLEADFARAIGVLLGVSATSDVVDASVVLCARLYRQGVITSDPEDLRKLDRKLPLTTI